jgi:hypothetical protein
LLILGFFELLLVVVLLNGLDNVLVQFDDTNETNQAQRFEHLLDFAVHDVFGVVHACNGVDSIVRRLGAEKLSYAVEHPGNV